MKTSSSPPYYLKIDLDGMEGETAAPMSSHLVNQLLPRCYNYTMYIDSEDCKIPPTKTSAGLIGDLPILIAMVAFSAPPSLLPIVLAEHVRMNQWIPHQWPTGRK